jgi:hypothetical protein
VKAEAPVTGEVFERCVRDGVALEGLYSQCDVVSAFGERDVVKGPFQSWREGCDFVSQSESYRYHRWGIVGSSVEEASCYQVFVASEDGGSNEIGGEGGQAGVSVLMVLVGEHG